LSSKSRVDDKPREECGIFGVFGRGLDVARITCYGLYALQHRGQESAGIATSGGSGVMLQKGMGLVSEVFSPGKLDGLNGHIAIGHVRYSTTGSSQPINAQPLVFRYARGTLGLAHNGNITNIYDLRLQLTSTGSVFQSTTDSEVIVNLIARYSQNTLEEALAKCMIDVKGAYSLVIITENSLIAVRDPYGFRPLSLGRLGEGYVVSSESCAMDTVGALKLRDVEPGETVIIDDRGVRSLHALSPRRKAHCIFEYIYFARPDSVMDGFHVGRVRREMGRQLALEYPADVDIVIPVPDSGTTAARGYSEQSGIQFEEGLMKNRYIGRTFIQPSQDMRDTGVRLKLNPVRYILEDKKVLMVDDSLVRGTTSNKIVQMLRDCGVKEVHLCLSSPPIIKPCYYGIDTNEDELVAAHMPVGEIKSMIGVDGLHFLSIKGLLNIFGEYRNNFCTACFDGKYPVQISRPGESGKYALE
jgi:amidophosphoribosyltransferase